MWADQFRINFVLKNQSSITSIAYCLSSIIIVMLSVIINRPCFLLLIKKDRVKKRLMKTFTCCSTCSLSYQNSLPYLYGMDEPGRILGVLFQ